MADISNEPDSANLVIVQGSDFSFGVTITDPSTDFTGTTTGRAKIVKDFASMTLVIAMTVTITSASNGLLTATISLTKTQTAALTATAPTSRDVALGQWDFEIDVAAASKTVRYIEGAASLSLRASA